MVCSDPEHNLLHSLTQCYRITKQHEPPLLQHTKQYEASHNNLKHTHYWCFVFCFHLYLDSLCHVAAFGSAGGMLPPFLSSRRLTNRYTFAWSPRLAAVQEYQRCGEFPFSDPRLSGASNILSPTLDSLAALHFSSRYKSTIPEKQENFPLAFFVS